MKNHKITIIVKAKSYDAVKATVDHLRWDILPECEGLGKLTSIQQEVYTREVQGFQEEDIRCQAKQDGHRYVKNADVDQIMDLMEDRFDANYGMSWDVISDCILDVLE